MLLEKGMSREDIASLLKVFLELVKKYINGQQRPYRTKIPQSLALLGVINLGINVNTNTIELRAYTAAAALRAAFTTNPLLT
jgi:transcriptional regulator with XRE-family HTH domain